TFIWRLKPLTLPQNDLSLPLAVYLGNFAFATIMSLAAGIYIPILLGLILGVLPLVVLYQMATTKSKVSAPDERLKAEVI
ncbi:MAG: carotenoid biosynthesis protein, partial [Chamaesiphon sp.]|nr:carotenoid biosynthesis protein [Chamaesiphon sp.]